MRPSRLLAVTVVFAALAGPAAIAQTLPDQAPPSQPTDTPAPVGTGQPPSTGASRPHGRHNRDGATTARPPHLADLTPQIDPWPRLDPGATICRSLPDLRRLAARQLDPAAASASAPPSCGIVPEMVAVSILGRNGPGATEIQLAGTGPAWTNAFLPDRAPVAATPAGNAYTPRAR